METNGFQFYAIANLDKISLIYLGVRRNAKRYAFSVATQTVRLSTQNLNLKLTRANLKLPP